MDEIKECPFCGSTRVFTANSKSKSWYWIECAKCGADGPQDLGESGAIEQWNSAPRIEKDQS